MKKRYLGIFMAALMGMTLMGCQSEEGNQEQTAKEEQTASEESADSGESDDSAYKVGFSAGYSKVQHWELEIGGAQAAADEAGVEMIYQFANGDQQKQIQDIENMVEMGIDMLIVGPCNSEGIVPTVNELKEKGIPVMTSDIGITGTEVVAHVASDNYKIGTMAAEYMGEMLGGEGKIAIVGWASASATKDREDGFTDTLTEKYPDIEIITSQDVGGDRTKSLETCENIIQSNSDINAIFGCNAECALGAYNATQSVNRTDINIVAVDSDSEVMEAIKGETNLKATIAQNPYEMGHKAMETAIASLNGEEEEDAAIEAELVTSENVQEIIDRDEAFLNP